MTNDKFSSNMTDEQLKDIKLKDRKQDCKANFIQVLYAVAKDPDISGLTFSEDPESENSLILKVRD